MAGFPYHQLDSYLGKLIAAGLRAAVCEQVEDPKLAKGLVRREVTRVVTPGTVTDDALLDPRESNFLAAVSSGDPAGLAWVELSTGRFTAAGFSARQLPDQLARIAPAECLLSDDGPPLPSNGGDRMMVTRPPGLGVFRAERAAGAQQTFWHGRAGGVRFHRRSGRRSGDSRRRGHPRLSGRDAKKFARPYRSPDAVSQFGHTGDRPVELAQPGDHPHHPRGPPRRFAVVGARSDGHRDGLAAAGPMGGQSAYRRGGDPRPAGGRRAVGRRPAAVRRPARDRSAAYTTCERLLARVTTGRASPRDLGFSGSDAAWAAGN